MKTPLHCLPPDTSDVLFYLMIWIYTCQTLYLSTRKTLMCVLCNKVSSLLRSDTSWFFTGTLIWYHTYTQTNTHTHTRTLTHTKTQSTLGPVDWLNHINTYLYHLLCAHSSYLYYTEWIIHWYQKFTFYSVFSFQKLFTCKSHISVD